MWSKHFAQHRCKLIVSFNLYAISRKLALLSALHRWRNKPRVAIWPCRGHALQADSILQEGNEAQIVWRTCSGILWLIEWETDMKGEGVWIQDAQAFHLDVFQTARAVRYGRQASSSFCCYHCCGAWVNWPSAIYRWDCALYLWPLRLKLARSL